MLTTRRITTDEELAALERAWNTLADGEPLRSWDWLATWWRHYGRVGDRELYVIAVYDGDALLSIAPWYVDRSLAKGHTIRFLGDGHVCTDHSSIVCRADEVPRITIALTEALATDVDWDRIEFEAIDEMDAAIGALINNLEGRECLASSRLVSNCWVLDLPESWDDYLGLISQSHRRQLKKCQRDVIDTGRARLHVVKTQTDLDVAWPILIDLHQMRRKSLGEPGCFASRIFGEFHRELAERLLSKGQLRLSWIEFDGTPFAADYHFAGGATIYTYQSGVDTDRLHDSPGRVSYLLTIQRAIADGFRRVDFMRGDEGYKAHFRAVAKRQFEFRVFPNRRLARLRGHLEFAGLSVKQWVKQGMASVLS